MLFLLDPNIDSLNAARITAEGQADFWVKILVFSTIVVGIGIIVETIGESAEIWEDWKTNKELKGRHIAVLIGALFVIIFVGLEGIAEWKIGTDEDQIRTRNSEIEQLLIRAATKAGASANDAVTDVDIAKQKLDQVSGEADALSGQLASASRKLKNLEFEIIVQSPRRGLIKSASPTLIKSLAKFSNQGIRLFICGRMGTQEGDMMGTWGSIADLLEGDKSAKWSVEKGGLEYFDRCSPSGANPLGEGLNVFVSDKASEKTAKAARVLSQGLTAVLPPSSNKILSVVQSDFSKKYSQPIEGPNTPWAMVANDPDLITVLIGAHPQETNK
jgi:hypothetical protein